MLAIGRALMAGPKVLLLDEPSLGLAPLLVLQIFEIVREINAQGITVVLVEQNAHQALRVAQRAYVLETGALALSGAAADLARDPRVRQAYLGDAS
jgi:branched-chain amino acid transport system ATP-binding protein